MAATFSNPRWDALPCERMRGCTFADDFLTLERIAQNNGTDSGTGNAADHGLTADGNGYVDYDIVSQEASFSVVLRFSAAAATTRGILLCNANLIDGGIVDGFCIWVDATGVRANHSDGATIPTRCSVDISYADGETHTITYVVDKTGGTHDLYVDALDVDSQVTAIVAATGASGTIRAAGDGTDNFVGTLYKSRVLDATLTEDEHDTYHAGTLQSAYWAPLAAYRCDDFCDDTVGNKLWDRTTATNDLTKGNGSLSAGFPTFETDHYVFDGVDDYVSGAPNLPAAYTVSAVKNDISPWRYPEIQQDNDTTFKSTLEAAGSFAGWLHSMILHPEVLNQLQLYHDEYMQLYWVDRCWAWGAYHRLITEGSCVYFGVFTRSGALRDWSDNVNGVHIHDITLDSDGLAMPSSDSFLDRDHVDVLNCTELTIVVDGDFSGVVAGGALVDKGTNYKFTTFGNFIRLSGSTIAHTFSSNKQVAVTARSGYKPRFYVDGEYIGEGTTVETFSSDAGPLTIGNDNVHNYETLYTLEKVCICRNALTDSEIKALYDQRETYGSENNMSMNRVLQDDTGAAAISFSVFVADDFDVKYISIKLSSAPTSAGLITVKIDSENGANYDTVWRSANPVGKTSIVFEALEGLQNGDKIQVDYANPDSRTYYISAVSQQ